MKIKAVSYCRVSSREQEETGYSLEAQEKLLNEYAEKNGYEVIKIYKVTESASGSKQRETFADMMKFLEKNGIKILICEKTDRLTRNRKDAVIVDEWVRKSSDNQTHFVKENFVLSRDSRANEKFIWGIKVEVAQYYTNNLSEEVKKGQKEKLSQGWLPTKPPIGYKTIGEKGHKIHIIDQEFAPFVKRMFELYGSGNYSMKAVIEALYNEGFRTRAGHKMVKSACESILSNPFYYGAMEWMDEIYTNGAHEPLITKELFDKVQNIRSGKKTPHFSRHKFQFRKMIKCGECGGTITAEIQKGIVYYHCSHYKGCTQKKYTPEDKLEEKLFGVFKFFENITPEEAEEIKLKIKENHAQEIEYKENTIRTITERYNSLQRRLDNLYNDRLDGRITLAFWEVKNKEIVDEQSATLEQIDRLKTEEAKYFEIWLNIIDLARRAREIYEKRTPEEKRILLTHIFSNLVLKDNNVSYTLREPLQKLSERVQQRLDTEKIFEPKKALRHKTKDSSCFKINSLLRR